MDEYSVPGPSAAESRVLERCVEVGRAAGVFPVTIAVVAVLLVEDPGRLLEIGSHLAAIFQEGAHPVVVLPVLVDRLLHAWRHLQMEPAADRLPGSLDDPCHDGLSRMLDQMIGVVLHIPVSADACVEGDDDQTSPGPRVTGADLGQMVRIEHHRMGGTEFEGILVLLFRLDLVGAAEDLRRRGVEPRALLEFGGDHQALALELGDLGLDVAFASRGQRIGRDGAAVGPHHPRYGVPEGGLAVAALAIGDDERLQAHLADRGDADDLLHVFDQVPVVAEEQVQCLLPFVHALLAGCAQRALGDEILGAGFAFAGQPQLQVVGCPGCVQQERVAIQILDIDEHHGLGCLQGSHHILHVTPLHDEGLVGHCRQIAFVGDEDLSRKARLELLPSGDYLGFVKAKGDQCLQGRR